MPFGKLQVGCYVSFTEEWLPSDHSTVKAGLVECCRDGCLSVNFSHLHRGTLELCQSDHRVLGHLPDQGLLPRSISLAGRPALGRVFLVPNFFHLRMMEPTVFLGPSTLQKCLRTLPQICASTQSCLGALQTIPLTSWLGFGSDIHCQLWDII